MYFPYKLKAGQVLALIIGASLVAMAELKVSLYVPNIQQKNKLSKSNYIQGDMQALIYT